MPTWNAEMDRKLLLAILKVHNFSIDKQKVAEELTTEDEPCTSMAIQKRLQAINKMIKDENGDSSPKPKATPRKRGAAASNDESPAKKAKAAKGKGGKGKAGGSEEGDDDEVAHSMVKPEDADEDELLNF